MLACATNLGGGAIVGTNREDLDPGTLLMTALANFLGFLAVVVVMIRFRQMPRAQGTLLERLPPAFCMPFPLVTAALLRPSPVFKIACYKPGFLKTLCCSAPRVLFLMAGDSIFLKMWPTGCTLKQLVRCEMLLYRTLQFHLRCINFYKMSFFVYGMRCDNY